MLERRGFRPHRVLIGTLVAIIGLCYLIETFIVPVGLGVGPITALFPQIPEAR